MIVDATNPFSIDRTQISDNLFEYSIRPAVDLSTRRGEREHVDMVIVQSRQKRTTIALDYTFPRL